MSIDFDFTELNKLAANLGQVPVKTFPLVRKAVEVTARNIKDDWQSGAVKVSGLHARLYPKSIDYDLGLDTDGAITAEIGPNLGKVQGSLGILEDAPGGVRSSPQNAGRKATKKNEQDFMNGLAKAAEEAI